MLTTLHCLKVEFVTDNTTAGTLSIFNIRDRKKDSDSPANRVEGLPVTVA